MLLRFYGFTVSDSQTVGETQDGKREKNPGCPNSDQSSASGKGGAADSGPPTRGIHTWQLILAAVTLTVRRSPASFAGTQAPRDRSCTKHSVMWPELRLTGPTPVWL